MSSPNPSIPYNPLDKEKLGESVANALLKSPMTSLPPPPFEGSGVYALFYRGSFPAYAQISGTENPIYVGKAVPAGSRKGHLLTESAKGSSLYQRLREHSESMDQVGLGPGDFSCRFLVVDDIWIPLGESLLILGTSQVHHFTGKNPFLIIGTFHPKHVSQLSLF